MIVKPLKKWLMKFLQRQILWLVAAVEQLQLARLAMQRLADSDSGFQKPLSRKPIGRVFPVINLASVGHQSFNHWRSDRAFRT